MGYREGMKIAIVNSKGGVGKSTSSIYLGAALSRQGTVRVVDTDPQGTATDWAERCIEAGTPLPFEVDVANVVTLKRLTETTDFTLIDTPPGDPTTIDAALRLADLVIVPSAPGVTDMARVWETLEISSALAPSYVLFTAVDRRSRDLKDAKAALEREGAGYFDNDIPFRKDVRNALGRVPDRMFNYDQVAAEILEVI